MMAVTHDVEIDKDKNALLDEALEALFENWASMRERERALSSIIRAFNSNLQEEFLDKKFKTLLHQCLSCIKRGSAKEIALACRVIGLLAIAVGCGENATEIVQESISAISQSLLKSSSELSKKAAMVECLAIFTFVGADEREETERAMQIMWQLIRPELGPNVVAVKPSTALIADVVSAWSFLLTTLDERNCDPKDLQDLLSYLSTLLDMEDRSVRITAGEALALIFEMRILDKFSESKGSIVENILGLQRKILNQIRDLSAEAAGKGSSKKDLNSQRNTFRDILDYLEERYSPET